MVSIETIAGLPAEAIRQLLPDWVAAHVSAGPEVHDRMRVDVTAALEEASDQAVQTMQDTFLRAGDGYVLYPADPLARRITRAFMGQLSPGWQVEGRDALERFLTTGPRRRMIVCNHLSYTDTQLTDSILCLAGQAAVADRLVAIAGPKVYTDPWRRMAAVALNTRKTAQSSAVATEQANVTPRELAAIAFETIADCERLMDAGSLVLLYPEGSRSRTGRLRPFLRASSRYLQMGELQILPIAQTGSERVYPIDSPLMYAHPVRIAIGEPFLASEHPGKAVALAEAHRRVAALLPEPYQPAEGDPAVG